MKCRKFNALIKWKMFIENLKIVTKIETIGNWKEMKIFWTKQGIQNVHLYLKKRKY